MGGSPRDPGCGGGGGKGAEETAVARGPGRDVGCNSGDCSQIPRGTSRSTRPPPSLSPTRSSCFLLHTKTTLATPSRWPHSAALPLHSFPPGAGWALTVRAWASGSAAGTPRPAGAPQGGGDGRRGGGGAEVGGRQQGWGGRGGGQAGLAEAAGHSGGHQAAKREGARTVAGQALYGLRRAALLACAGHGAPWSLRGHSGEVSGATAGGLRDPTLQTPRLEVTHAHDGG